MGKNKNKLKAIYPKIIENLRATSLGYNFIGSYKKSVSLFR